MTETMKHLTSAADRYLTRCEAADRRAKRLSNPYRAGLVLKAVDRVNNAYLNGTPLRAAIVQHTNDRLQAALLKGLKLDPATREEARGDFNVRD